MFGGSTKGRWFTQRRAYVAATMVAAVVSVAAVLQVVGAVSADDYRKWRVLGSGEGISFYYDHDTISKASLATAYLFKPELANRVEVVFYVPWIEVAQKNLEHAVISLIREGKIKMTIKPMDAEYWVTVNGEKTAARYFPIDDDAEFMTTAKGLAATNENFGVTLSIAHETSEMIQTLFHPHGKDVKLISWEPEPVDVVSGWENIEREKLRERIKAALEALQAAETARSRDQEDTNTVIPSPVPEKAE